MVLVRLPTGFLASVSSAVIIARANFSPRRSSVLLATALAAYWDGLRGGVQVTMKLVFVSARPVLIMAKEMALLSTPAPSAS